MKKVLFIDDQLDIWIDIMKEGLSKFDFEVIGESDPMNTLSMIKKHSPNAIMLDIQFGKEGNLGKPTLEKIKGNKKYSNIPVMMITNTEANDDYNPNDYTLASSKYSKVLLEKSEDFEDLANKLNEIIEKAIANDDLSQLGSNDLIIGNTTKMKEIYKIIPKIAITDETVLITGESGTGKEMIARLIMNKSKRAEGPYVCVNCGAIPDNLLESELFGYEKGAFTGAVNSKPGKFELADNGTIFLDEIGDLPLNLQVKILRVLQEKEIDRVGGTNPIQTDVRIIAATNKNLIEEINKGTFREDLYYRLNIVYIDLPPLRERKEDFKIFYEHFIIKYSGEYGNRKALDLRNDVLEKFNSYKWPGNIRQFESAIKKAILLTSNTVLQLDDFKELEESSQADFVNINEIIQEIWEEKHTWDSLDFKKNSPQKTLILKGVVDMWLSERKVRPKHKDLAKLFKISPRNMQQKFEECGLSPLTEKWPERIE